MRLRILGLAAVLAAMALVGVSRPASAQGLASLAAVGTVTTGATSVQKAGCWGCDTWLGIPYCASGVVPGFWNCTSSLMRMCDTSSPGCGAGAALPVDVDGATQYVSRGSLLGVLADGGPPVKLNCEGVIVARQQTPGDIATVRGRTGTLTL